VVALLEAVGEGRASEDDALARTVQEAVEDAVAKPDIGRRTILRGRCRTGVGVALWKHRETRRNRGPDRSRGTGLRP